MTFASHFTHHQPSTLAEARELLASLGPSARLVAGGTELLPKLRAGALTAEHLVSVNRIGELSQIDFEEGQLHIGAGLRLSDVATHDVAQQHFPALAHACAEMATPQIRNMGTVAGNLVNGSPCADTAGPLLIYEAQITLVSSGNERRVPLSSFFRGPSEVDITPTELLTRIHVAVPPARTGSSYLRLSARSSVDVAAASVAGLVELAENGTIAEARVALGAVAPTPLRCPEGEKLLAGKKPTPELLDQAAAACAAIASPIDDVRATAAYRQAILPVMIRRILQRCLEHAAGRPR